MKKYILFFLLTATTITYAQPDLNFIRYTSQQGLIYNDVLCIYQDHLGFIWFGTKYGCSRFDGIEFKNYQYNENDPGSIGPGWVNQIVSDNKNRLWFAIAGPGGTFMRYDYESDKFIDISPSIKTQLNIGDKILDLWKIYPGNDGHIWLAATQYGLIRYNPKTDHIETFNQQINTKKISLVEDFSEDVTWFATWSGVFIYNKKTGLFTNYKHDPDNLSSLSSDNCTQIFQDSKNQIWIATYNGLNKLKPSSTNGVTFKHFMHDPKDPFSLSNNLVYDIAENNDGNLLIATVNGLCLMDKTTNKIYRYFNSEIDDESINSNLVRSLYKDNQGNIWIATNAGIGKLQVKNFKSFSQSSYKNSISHNKVQFLCEAPDKNIWIATPKGIDVFDRESNKFHFLAGVTKNEKGLYGAPLVFYPNMDKGMWVGTWQGGISYFNSVANKITNYTVETKKSINTVFSVFMDSKAKLWIGSSQEGIYVYEKQTKNYKNFSYNEQNENTLSSNRVSTIMEDSESDIWIGTQNGLNKLIDFNNGAFKCYFAGIEIQQIVEISEKNFWIATNQGLYQFNKALQDFKRFSTSDGLPGNTILGILEDSLKNLWVSTNNGLAKLKVSEDSLTNITVYREEDGLSVGNFLERSCVKLSDGTMMYGGTGGFCMFNPSEIENDTLPPKIVFTKLKVANELVKIEQEINGQVILQESITTTDRLTLNYKNNAFSIQFAGLQYNMPQYNQYCYRLDGYDSDESKWHYTNSNNRYAEYMNLPRGNYIFKVKAANSYGIWNNQPAELRITILPPWWQTFWFISLILLLLVILIVLIVRIRTYNLHKQKLKLEKIVERRTTELKEMNVILNDRKEELEAQMEQMAKMNENLEAKTIQIENMAKQLHEADQSKLQFFANVSHEFRTPLSLIITPLEKLLSFKKPILLDKINIIDYHQLMHKNAKRLLRLINQVLDFRKIEHGDIKLNITNNNIVEFTKEVVTAFSAQAEEKNISLTLESKYPTFEFWFDSDIMEKILYNLISNAIKYTPERGEISIQLSVNNEQSTGNNNQLPVNSNQSLNNEKLIIKVVDTGIGIKKEGLDKIFDRFYRVESNKTLKEEGTGIGLAYTKELVELHKGIISVESKLGSGTCFILKFPMRKEHFNQRESNEESTIVNLKYIRSMIEDIEVKTPEIINKEDGEYGVDTEKPTILLVEDNADLRNFIKNELSVQYYVYEAENGEKGWHMANEIYPNLIISDIMMPVMDGKELCKKIKINKDTCHIPVILLTAKGGDENIMEGLETGADDYITKPFNINILTIKIKNLFLLQKRMQEKFSQSINIVPSEITHSLMDQQFIQKAIDLINKHIHDYNFDNDSFVELMNYGRTQVYKKIKTLTGQSVSEFIRSVRLKTAAQLFLQGHDNVTEVCYKTGFKHPNTFSQYFSKMFGKPPSQFIKETLKK